MRVETVRAQANATDEEIDLLFGALADSTRRTMIARLAHGPMSIGELGSPFPITKPAVTKHVKILERAGLVRRDRTGRVHTLTLRPRAMRQAEAWIEVHREFWQASLDSLAHYVEGVQSSTKEEE